MVPDGPDRSAKREIWTLQNLLFKKSFRWIRRREQPTPILGVIAMRRRNWDEALSKLNRAEALLPGTSGIKLNIGLVEFRRGNYRSAIPPLESAVENTSRMPAQPRYLLGLCQVFLEEYSAAARTLEPMWSTMAGDLMYLYVLRHCSQQIRR